MENGMADKGTSNQRKRKRPERDMDALRGEPEPSRSRVRAREEDYIESRFPKQQAALVALVVLAVFCVVGGRQIGDTAVAVLCVVIFIEMLMGFFLGNAPSCITVTLTALMALVGMLTKTSGAVIPGCVVFIATVLVVKDK